MNTVPEYIVNRAEGDLPLKGAWDSPAWSQANNADISSFRPESSAHRPATRAKLLYTTKGIHGIFRVEDRYVRCVHTHYMDPVYKDSCVEFFVKPKLDPGYFNFEFNCGGTLLCSYITNPERIAGGFKEFIPLPKEEGDKVRIYHSLPSLVEPEMQEPLVWIVEFFIPFSLLEHYAGSLGEMKGQVWRGNFYKCADATSHPHWASWAPVDALNFHLSRCFGRLIFA